MMLLLIIIISLYLGYNETFDLQLPNSNYTFKGDFDRTCDTCAFNENSKLLTCNCSRQDPRFPKDTTKRIIAPTALTLTDTDMQNLQQRFISNNNGKLGIRIIKTTS
jgi:hypothetical protein